MLRIWGRKTSSNVQALMWCVGELGLRGDYDALSLRPAFRERVMMSCAPC